MISTPPRRIGRIALIVGVALGTAACGGSDSADGTQATDSPATSATAEPAPPTTGADDGGSGTSVPASGPTTDASTAPADVTGGVPTQILSLSPTATEMLFAIGAGDQILGVDTLSDYPAETADLQTGIEAFTPNVEQIAALKPDLVITDGSNPDILAQFDQLGLAHWEGPAASTLDDVYAQIEQLGAATGHVGEAAELVGQMQTDIKTEVESVPPATGTSYYHELDSTYYSVTSDTFVGQVYDLFGLTNIADESPEAAESPYPQLSAEYIIEANPDMIFLGCGDFCTDTPEDVAKRPGWDQITAVKDNIVLTPDGDVVSRWGPRVVEFVHYVAAALLDTAPLVDANG